MDLVLWEFSGEEDGVLLLLEVGAGVWVVDIVGSGGAEMVERTVLDLTCAVHRALAGKRDDRLMGSWAKRTSIGRICQSEDWEEGTEYTFVCEGRTPDLQIFVGYVYIQDVAKCRQVAEPGVQSVVVEGRDIVEEQRRRTDVTVELRQDWERVADGMDDGSRSPGSAGPVVVL